MNEPPHILKASYPPVKINLISYSPPSADTHPINFCGCLLCPQPQPAGLIKAMVIGAAASECLRRLKQHFTFVHTCEVSERKLNKGGRQSGRGLGPAGKISAADNDALFELIEAKPI